MTPELTAAALLTPDDPDLPPNTTCAWCGETSCAQRDEHDRLNRMRETTWREGTRR